MPIERDWNYKMNNETIKYYIMEIIKNKEFGGERPLFATHDLQLENVTIHTGESALKECSNIIAVNCRFEGKYPFWHTKELPFYGGSTGGPVVFPKSPNDGYGSRGPEDVP